jgi:hypothetical protein
MRFSLNVTRSRQKNPYENGTEGGSRCPSGDFRSAVEPTVVALRISIEWFIGGVGVTSRESCLT